MRQDGRLRQQQHARGNKVRAVGALVLATVLSGYAAPLMQGSCKYESGTTHNGVQGYWREYTSETNAYTVRYFVDNINYEVHDAIVYDNMNNIEVDLDYLSSESCGVPSPWRHTLRDESEDGHTEEGADDLDGAWAQERTQAAYSNCDVC